jgi:hypothetical protein
VKGLAMTIDKTNGSAASPPSDLLTASPEEIGPSSAWHGPIGAVAEMRAISVRHVLRCLGVVANESGPSAKPFARANWP